MRTTGVLAGLIFLIAAIWGATQVMGGDDKANAADGDTTPTATTAPANTPTPVPVQPTPAPSQAAANAACPTDGQMQALFGFDKMNPPIKPVFTGQSVPWEPCKWSLQWTGPGTLGLQMLPNWQFTVTRGNENVEVWYGDGQTRDVKGATIRFTPAYVGNAGSWVTDGCTLLSKENDFGHGRNPAYDTINGNVCINGKSQPALTSQTGSSNSGTTTFNLLQECASATPQQVAQVVGGDPAGWSREDPGNFPTTWKYKKKGTNVQLTNPGAPATIDYWDGGVKTATQQGPLPVQVDEATLKCTGN